MRNVSLCLLLLLVAGCTRNTEAAPAPATESAKRLAAANNKFGLEYLSKNYEQKKNQAISPVSLATALHLAATGAGGETRKQMITVLQAGGLDTGAANRELIDALNGTKGVTLTVANSIWVDPNRMKLSDGYRKSAEAQFDAAARELDFGSPKARDTINGWVSERTNKRIPELIDAIDAQAVTYLINAVYFKGEWTVRFDKDRTKDADFALEDGTKKKVPMMWRDDKYDSGTDGKTTVVRLTFGKEKSASIWFALPAKDSDAGKLVASMDAEAIARWGKTVEKTEDVPLYLPRFSFKYKTEGSRVLQAMGMTHAFDESKADFSPMGKAGQGNMHISRVLHEVFIEVNEEGAEAAAATGVEMKATMAPQPIMFNRPFAFAITDEGSGAVLFVGVVHDPKP